MQRALLHSVRQNLLQFKTHPHIKTFSSLNNDFVQWPKKKDSTLVSPSAYSPLPLNTQREPAAPEMHPLLWMNDGTRRAEWWVQRLFLCLDWIWVHLVIQMSLYVKSTNPGAEELMVDCGLSVSLHEVIALWIKAIVGGCGTHIYKPLQWGVYPVAPQLWRENERQFST